MGATGRPYHQLMPDPQGPPAPPPPGKPAPKPPDMFAPMRSLRFWVILGILFAANFIISNLFFSAGQPQTVTIPYNVFIQQINNDNVVSITSTADAILGTTKKPVAESPGGATSTQFQTQRPQFATDDLETLLQQPQRDHQRQEPQPADAVVADAARRLRPDALLIVAGFLYLIAARPGSGKRRDPRQLRPEPGSALRRRAAGGHASPTLRASTRSRRSCRRWSTSCASRRSTSASAARCPRACC